MIKKITYFLLLFFILIPQINFAQNETGKWYFGNGAGLDFMSSPPGIIVNSSMNNAFHTSASISNSSGSLLFYTDGNTVWNSVNNVMSNGSGLIGGNNGQTTLIVKMPGNNSLYLIFTTGSSGALYNSTVDMGLAAGMGSVTVKNNLVFSGYCEPKLTGTKHCNGVDFWILAREQYHNINNPNPVFRAYLLSSTGLSATATLSPSSFISNAVNQGSMKISPTGKKLAIANYQVSSFTTGFELLDFDNSTGVVSNSLTLMSGLNISLINPYVLYASAPFGVEFSSDGTKVYGSVAATGVPSINSGSFATSALYQWNICAGISSAIQASQITIATQTIVSASGSYTASNLSPYGYLQLAKDGKIYMARYGLQTLDVINNPNLSGAACNYVQGGQSIAPKICRQGLPNFITSSLLQKSPPSPFSYTVSNSLGCQAAAFLAATVPTVYGCTASGFTLSNVTWNFGDPASGTANSSNLLNPIHAFTSLGTYTVKLIYNYSCGGGSDTLSQIVQINQSCIVVNSTSITCASLGSATVISTAAGGPFSYTWTPTGQTNSVATGLSPGTYTIKVFDFANNFTYTASTIFTSLIPLTGTLNATSSITCNGAATGTANYSNFAGGSGSENYLWTNGLLSYTAPNPINLSAGTWSALVTDALTGCTINNTFVITQPPAMTLTIGANTPTACAGNNIVLTGSHSGGTPPYLYNWVGGPASNTFVVSESINGSYIYSLNSSDANNCQNNKTVAVTFVPNPTISVANVSICPLGYGTLSVTGATGYTWSGGTVGSVLTDNPLVNTQYTVIGTALGCTTAAAASIIVMPVPVPTLITNSPRCNGDQLILNGSGGTFYVWSGPLGYASFGQQTTLNVVGLANAGVYNLTVTAANDCTAATNASVVVHPTPTLSVFGSTVCTSQTMSLSANSISGASYNWLGPQNFSSTLQTINISSPALNRSGVYNLTVTSVFGCRNTGSAHVQIVSPPNLTVALSSQSMCAQALSGSSNTIVLSSGGATTYTLSTPAHMYNSNPNGSVSQLSLLPPFLPTGVSTATLLGSNGICLSSITSSFNIVPNPTLGIISATPVICAGESYTYTSSGASSYSWTSANPNNYIYTTGNIAVANPSIQSVFSVVGSSLGCLSAIQSSTIRVNPLPVFGIGGKREICPGETSVLVSTPLNGSGSSISYTWTPPNFLNNAYSATVIAGPAATQNYTVIGSLNNCTTAVVITLSVLPLPFAQIGAAKTTFCENDNIELSGSGGPGVIGAYSWNSPASYTFTGKDLKLKAVSKAFGGTYTLTVQDENNCKSSSTQLVTVYGLPQGYLSSTQENRCAPFCSELVFKTNATSAPIDKFNWQVENFNFVGNRFKYCFNTAGDYPIIGEITDTNSCVNTVTTVVHVFRKPKADFNFSPQRAIENLETVQFTDASTGAEHYTWYFGNTFNFSTHKDPAFLFENTGTYPVVLVASNKWKCSDTVIKTIYIDPDFAVYMPNAFTPNEDGLNETLLPAMRGSTTFNFLVFDRWGKKIFETSDNTKGWDGTFKGEPCAQGVYVWQLEVRSQSGKNLSSGLYTKSFSGELLLYR